ncbi:MAG: hypothetical protein LQ342_000176 [Letrouitia transgressa]|nr:MAG: hypothetical protein LQ342_000176 [Letrouitia transgressa]
MSLDEAPHGDQSTSTHNGTKTTHQTLKTKRSISRLFSSSLRSSRSRASSTEELQTPPTPTIPDQFQPSAKKNSAPSTPTTTGNYDTHHLHNTSRRSTDTLEAPPRKDAARGDGLRGILKSKKETDGDEKVLQDEFQPLPGSKILSPLSTTNPGNHNLREKPLIQHSPTFPKAKKRHNGELGRSSLTRLRGSSTSSPKASRLHIATDDLLSMPRPSTAGGDSRERWSRVEEPRLNKKFGDLNPVTASEPDLAGLPFNRLRKTMSEADEVRRSFRSAVTATSSFVETPTTTRSSVLSKDTAISEMTVESPRASDTEEGLTVDEAIGMYEAGFTDDVEAQSGTPTRSSTSEEDRRRSVKIAEAINDKMGSGIDSSPSPSIADLRSPTTTTMSAKINGHSSEASLVTPSTTVRDQYGFFKASRHVSIQQYDAWNSAYVLDQERRKRKWFTYMREQGCSTFCPVQFPDRSPKTQRYIRKGIPAAWRGAAWFYYAGGPALREENPTVYSSLVSRAETSGLDPNDQESIERDLHRTFPDNIHFKPDAPPTQQPADEAPLLTSLRRVLQAFAIHHPEIGYCQSLNFLTGLLLLFLPEEQAFWMLHIITTTILPGTHELSLEGANVDLWVLMMALRESVPTIWAKVGIATTSSDPAAAEGPAHTPTAKLPPISLCTTSWFMSLFIGTLPVESVLRVWDVLFYEGSKVLFWVALAVFRLGEPCIRQIGDPIELFQVVQALPRGLLDAGALMKVAIRRGGVSQEWVSRKRKERRKWYALEKAKVAGAGAVPVAPDKGVREALVKLSRTDSVWRRRRGHGNR